MRGSVMKCEVCLEQLEEYFDGELAEVEASQVGEHLITCSACAGEFATLTAEQELFTRYDREIEVSPGLWNSIAERSVPAAVSSGNGFLTWFAGLFAVRSLSFAGAVAVVLLAILIGVAYVVTRRPSTETVMTSATTIKQEQSLKPQQKAPVGPVQEKQRDIDIYRELHAKNLRRAVKAGQSDVIQDERGVELDVISTDLGRDQEDEDTARHLEQTQNLLRSIRNVRLSDSDDEVDVSYDKALSRRLLSENIVLRRDAEMKAKYPTKSLLTDVEPLLIDIANLPDLAKPEDVRTIQERVQKTEIVAALSEYQGRGTDR
jgi:Putative zinc-finger